MLELDIARNPEKAPFLGDKFGQTVEPSGIFVIQKNNYTPKGWLNGKALLQKPLFISLENGLTQWKFDLAKKYKAKKNKLTKKLMDEGYDSIVTVYSEGDYGEIILFPNCKYMLDKMQTEQFLKKKVLISEEVYKLLLKEDGTATEDEGEVGLSIIRQGIYFYIILLDEAGSIVGYIRLYRNKDKGFSMDTFSAISGYGQYMLMFATMIAYPHPITRDRGKGGNKASEFSIRKFVDSSNVRIADIDRDSKDYVMGSDTPFINTYIYGVGNKSLITHYLEQGRKITNEKNLSDEDLIASAERFFEKRYSGEF
jgi:hypothetical protein